MFICVSEDSVCVNEPSVWVEHATTNNTNTNFAKLLLYNDDSNLQRESERYGTTKVVVKITFIDVYWYNKHFSHSWTYTYKQNCKHPSEAYIWQIPKHLFTIRNMNCSFCLCISFHGRFAIDWLYQKRKSLFHKHSHTHTQTLSQTHDYPEICQL